MPSSSNSSAMGTWIRFKNRVCFCGKGKKAYLRISETSKNPGRLFFTCDGCKFFKWWSPDDEEWESIVQVVSTERNVSAAPSSNLDDNMQYEILSTKVLKAETMIMWLKCVILIHTVLIGIIIGMALSM
jgi:hypothetical protein